jgi:hypothetical protein
MDKGLFPQPAKNPVPANATYNPVVLQMEIGLRRKFSSDTRKKDTQRVVLNCPCPSERAQQFSGLSEENRFYASSYR